jgi:hypothetical protein
MAWHIVHACNSRKRWRVGTCGVTAVWCLFDFCVCVFKQRLFPLSGPARVKVWDTATEIVGNVGLPQGAPDWVVRLQLVFVTCHLVPLQRAVVSKSVRGASLSRSRQFKSSLCRCSLSAHANVATNHSVSRPTLPRCGYCPS